VAVPKDPEPKGSGSFLVFAALCQMLGSLSNVGVRCQGEKDSGPEGMEVSEAKGDTFQGSLSNVEWPRQSVSRPAGPIPARRPAFSFLAALVFVKYC